MPLLRKRAFEGSFDLSIEAEGEESLCSASNKFMLAKLTSLKYRKISNKIGNLW